MLVCTEVGTVFDDPQVVAHGELKATDTRLDFCPRCEEAPTDSFRTATSDEIRSLGFKPGDYE
jgi:hypothetical protein